MVIPHRKLLLVSNIFILKKKNPQYNNFKQEIKNEKKNQRVILWKAIIEDDKEVSEILMKPNKNQEEDI